MQLEQLKNSYKVLYHASVYIKEGIYVDPFNIDIEPHDAKYVFITHPHYDRLSSNDIEKVINEDTIIIATKDCLKLLKEAGINNKLFEVSVGNTYQIGKAKVTTIPAYNKTKAFHPYSNNWVGYKIEIDDISYYIIGDSDYNEYMDAIKCNVLFVPIGGTYTMDYVEASKLTNKINPDIVVPIHFNSIKGLEVNKADFIELINKDILVD